MSELNRIPRRSLGWLVVALLVAMGPHLLLQPWWLGIVLATAVGWRYHVWTGRWGLPRWPVKAILVAMSVTGVLLAYGSLIGVDPAMALLIIGCALKGIEFAQARDYIVLVFLAYFIAACNFIYEQEIPTTAYVLASLVVISAALVARYQSSARGSVIAPLRLSARMLVQAMPMMVVMFIVFPRISPLWSIPQPESHAKTGPSSDMSPGDIAQLSRSTDLAFRVTFDGETPRQRELYWRGLVLSDFDGRRWTMDRRTRFQSELAQQGAKRVRFDEESIESSGREMKYEIILEPTWQNWAFSLDVPLAGANQLRWTSDRSLVSQARLTQRIRYEVRSDPEARFGAELRPYSRHNNRALPEGFNPRAVAMAKEWFAEEESAEAFIDRVLRWFNRENFVYTLSPPVLGRHSIDEFLFDTRRGFCEHYASSFVFLLRAAGIPARVVVGYQGGERNAYEDYLLVYQYDAHAWAEAWLDGKGWVRFDPTASVAPQRVESSLQDVIGAEFLANTPLSLARFKNVGVLNWLRMNWDMLGYHWARLVLGYDSRRQYALLNGLLGAITPQRLAFFLLGSGGIVLGILAFTLLGGRVGRQLDPATREYLRLCGRLASRGVTRRIGEGPMDFAARVAQERPDLAPAIRAVTDTFVALSYGVEGDFNKFRRQARKLG